MGRSYSISFSGVSISALQDLLAIYCGAAMAVELHGFELGQITNTAILNLRYTVKRLPATVTSGSGGSAPTPRRMRPGDAAATATARTNDTVQATSTGTVEVIDAGVFNTINGVSFFWPPRDMPIIGLSQAAVISLDTLPPSAMVSNGTLYFAELL